MNPLSILSVVILAMVFASSATMTVNTSLMRGSWDFFDGSNILSIGALTALAATFVQNFKTWFPSVVPGPGVPTASTGIAGWIMWFLGIASGGQLGFVAQLFALIEALIKAKGVLPVYHSSKTVWADGTTLPIEWGKPPVIPGPAPSAQVVKLEIPVAPAPLPIPAVPAQPVIPQPQIPVQPQPAAPASVTIAP